MKMYILIKDSIPTGLAITAAAHASLMAHLRYENDTEYRRWLDTSFKKVVCAVSAEEFAAAINVDDCLVVTESSIDGAAVAIVFRPREEYPKAFKFYRLYR